MDNPFKLIRYDTKIHIENGVQMTFFVEDGVTIAADTVFVLERSENAECYVEIAELIAPFTDYYDFLVLDGARYRYRIRQKDQPEMEWVTGPRVLINKYGFVTVFNHADTIT